MAAIVPATMSRLDAVEAERWIAKEARRLDAAAGRWTVEEVRRSNAVEAER